MNNQLLTRNQPAQVANTEGRLSAPEHRGETETAVELREIRSKLDALIARLLPDVKPNADERSGHGLEPDMDVYENDVEFLIHAAVPGAAPDKIRIDATAHTITLTAKTSAPTEADSASTDAPSARRHRRSRHSDHDRFHFLYTLHTAIAPELAHAVFRHGIVEVHLPKAHSEPLSMQVPLTVYSASQVTETLASGSAAPDNSRAIIITSHEGSPRHKLGAAYSPNPGEDHTAKAQSVGERSRTGRS